MNKVFIIGTGPGAEDYIIPVARRKIEEADCIMGAERLTGIFKGLGKQQILIKKDFNKAIRFIKKNKDKKKIVVLVSGDPGMFSFLGMLSNALSPKDYAVIPGISTMQLAFARIGRSWCDARVVSLHGRKIDHLVAELRSSDRLFLLTDQKFPPDKIARYLMNEGFENLRAMVFENLSYPNERIVNTDLKRLGRMKGFGLCTMIIERDKPKPVHGKLYGIGIGPGDPGLVSLKAKAILGKVDTIFVPKSSEDTTSLARSIVEAITGAQKVFVELTFPMTKDREILNRFWAIAARKISKEVSNGRSVAFVTIGDPYIYSTYVYLVKTLRRDFPKVEIETIPGISAFNAAASAAGLSLVEGDETMAVVPVRQDLKGLEKTLKDFDTTVLMKVGSKLDKVIALLKRLGLLKHAVLISRVGHEDERIIRDLASLRDKRTGYLSVIIVKKGIR